MDEFWCDFLCPQQKTIVGESWWSDQHEGHLLYEGAALVWDELVENGLLFQVVVVGGGGWGCGGHR